LPFFILKKNHLAIFFFDWILFFFNLILQYLVDFKLIFTICFGLLSIRLLQFQINISVFNWCLILRVFIFIIISLSKK
jgi:hypothetical protein